MNLNVCIVGLVLAGTLLAKAQEAEKSFDPLAPISTYKAWNDPERLDKLLTNPRPSSTIALGKSDFVAGGPLVETFRWSRHQPVERNRVQKLLDLPIVNLFVPQPMPVPARGSGRYFAWGERNQPWVATVDRPLPGPQAALISVSR